MNGLLPKKIPIRLKFSSKTIDLDIIEPLLIDLLRFHDYIKDEEVLKITIYYWWIVVEYDIKRQVIIIGMLSGLYKKALYLFNK